MYKVIIVDDEPIIVEGMRRVIPWQDFDCEVVGTAEDGCEGVKLVKELRPDIIFTDIYMPGMDGLAMIAAIKSEFPEIEMSILSGFRDFNYAQDAIRLGVTRFLIKPSKLDEIREALETMIEKLKEKRFRRLAYEKTAGAEHLGSAAKAEEKAEEVPPEVAVAGSFVVSNAVKFLKENYMQKIKLNDIAEQVYVSQWHLSRLLNQHTGHSFYDLLNNIRIEKAKELLGDPSLRIGEIADLVGFQDLTHFSKVFKKQEGVTANDYRNKL
ncbi:MAG: response regulator [Lachnospiraceae bacterium]|nr:response regulator [Lachnospiraceae bacterium]